MLSKNENLRFSHMLPNSQFIINIYLFIPISIYTNLNIDMEPCFYKNERQLNIRREAELVVVAVYKVFSLESTDYLT